ncbi:hypothetical protein U8V97_22985 [Priestia filamentosa]|uniref:hypothetical protein n=1 Tax=Priestia filamentosa TaxID=1402861 RepID=UPI00397AE653
MKKGLGRDIPVFLLLLFTLLLSACSEKTEGTNTPNSGEKRAENKDENKELTNDEAKERELTHDEIVLLDAFLQLNHVSWDTSKSGSVEGVTGCEGDNCLGPDAFEEKQSDLSGTYYIASSIDTGDPNDYHVFLILPNNLAKKTYHKSNITHWLNDYRDSSLFMIDDDTEDVLTLGQKLASVDQIMSDPLMKKLNATYGLQWRKVEVEKDLYFDTGGSTQSNSNDKQSDIVGTWKPVEGDPCQAQIAELEFKEGNKLKAVSTEGIAVGGKYEELGSNLYNIILNNGVPSTEFTYSTKNGAPTLIITGAQGETCQFNKPKEQAVSNENHNKEAQKQVESRKKEENTDEGKVTYTSYTNKRFDFSFQYPEGLMMDSLATNDDGARFYNEEFEVRAYGGHTNTVNDGETIETYYQEDINTIPGEIVYKKLAEDWYVLSYQENGKTTYMKFFFGENVSNTLIITYPTSDKEKYDPITTHISKTFVSSAH